MALSKPLSYEGLRTVLQHLEPNTRFHMAQASPSIRNTEKSVPLKIDFLQPNLLEIQVNDTKWQLGSYRKYRDGVPVPEEHQADNEKIGNKLDLDQYGAPEIECSVEPYSPGDLPIEVARLGCQESHARFLERHNFIVKDAQDELGRMHVDPECDMDTIKKQKELIKLVKLRMEPYQNREWKRKPENYEVQAQIAVTSPNSQRILRFEKTKKLNEIMKQLTTFMFSGRRDVIRVKLLAFPHVPGTLRLPRGLKFKIRRLKVEKPIANDLDVLDNLIDKKSYPLEILETVKPLYHSAELSHPLEKSARKLVLHSPTYRPTWPFILSNLPNFEVHFHYNGLNLDDYMRIFEAVIEEWRRSGREVGTCFSADVNNIESSEFMKRLTKVAKGWNGVKTSERSLKIPLLFDSEIHVFYELKDENEHYKADDWDEIEEESGEGTLTILVVPIEN